VGVRQRQSPVSELPELAGQCSLSVLDLDPGEQPDRLSSEEIRQLLKQEAKI
jgi:hypothetical protein